MQVTNYSGDIIRMEALCYCTFRNQSLLFFSKSFRNALACTINTVTEQLSDGFVPFCCFLYLRGKQDDTVLKY